MARKLKVYGWIHHLRDKDIKKQLELPKHVAQVYACLATTSKAAVARAMGEKDHRQLFNLSETGHVPSVEKALSEPGTVFVSSMNSGKDCKYIPLPKLEK